ncbi:hypothetical protein V6Z11_A10G143300 [Gossypium hirsutum]
MLTCILVFEQRTIGIPGTHVPSFQHHCDIEDNFLK